MTGLDTIRETMVSFLREAGLSAVAAWSPEARRGSKGAAVAVSLRHCQSVTSGFRDYLGERQNEDTGAWEELYGKSLSVLFGLDIYCPAALGGGGCQAAFDQLAVALQTKQPAGLTVTALSRGAVRFEAETGLLCCEVTARCAAYLYAVADEGGQFVDFEVKGVRT